MPTKAFWKSLSDAPASFDAENVWTFTEKFITDAGVKRWRCPWCLKTFGGHNYTKALYHQAGVNGKEIVTCLGASNGEQPAWFTSALRSFIHRQDAAKKDKTKVRVAGIVLVSMRHVTNNPCHVPCAYAALPPRAPPICHISQALELRATFLKDDASGMTSQVLATRKRASLSSEAGPEGRQPTIVEGLLTSAPSAALSSAIADLILKKGLGYSLSGDVLLDRVIKCARLSPASYKAPHPAEIGGRYLDVASTRYESKNAALVTSVADKYGYSMMSDGATVMHVPLINVLAGIPNALPAMLEIADCTGHMQEGGSLASAHWVLFIGLAATVSIRL